MGKKLNRVYETLVEGAANGLSGKQLYEHVVENLPKTSSKRIVKASLLALTDPHVKDRGVLERIYDLAIQYRLSSLGVEDDEPEEEDDARVPLVSDALKTRLETSVSPLPASNAEATGVFGLPAGALPH